METQTVMEFKIENEGHTISSLLRPILMADKSIKFASCIVKHPQDQCMFMNIDSDNPKESFLECFEIANNVLVNIKKQLDAYQIHKSLLSQDVDMDCEDDTQVQHNSQNYMTSDEQKEDDLLTLKKLTRSQKVKVDSEHDDDKMQDKKNDKKQLKKDKKIVDETRDKKSNQIATEKSPDKPKRKRNAKMV